MKHPQIAQKNLRFRAYLLNIALVLSTLLTGLFFEPEIVSTYWHLEFGNAATIHGWTVPVPKGWWALTQGDQLIVNKMQRFYDRSEPLSIIVGTLRPSKPVEPDALKTALIHAISNQGYVFQEAQSIRIGASPGYCVHFTGATDPKRVRISCESVAAQVSLDLFGRQSEIQSFYFVLGQMKSAPDSTH
jgi:hypothetical protein